jgi:hypothetical protein
MSQHEAETEVKQELVVVKATKMKDNIWFNGLIAQKATKWSKTQWKTSKFRFAAAKQRWPLAQLVRAHP